MGREGNERCSPAGRGAARERRGRGRRAPAYALLVASLIPVAAWGQGPAWQGAWKTKDPNVLEHLTLDIAEPTPEGFSVSFDEGAGSGGYRGSGRARFLGPSRASVALEYAGRSCELTLSLSARELVAGGCRLGAGSESTEYVLVPASAPRFFSTGFNCARATGPVSKRICAERTLAGLDRSLSDWYGRLRVKLSKADQHRLRGEQREWLMRRDAECGALHDPGAQIRCLKRYYGSRLFSLQAWREFRVHVAGEPDFAAARAVAEAAKAAGKKAPNLLQMGLAPWLSGFMPFGVLETDEFVEYEASADEDRVVVSGVLSPAPDRRHLYQADKRRVIFVVHARQGIWFGDTFGSPTVYAQPHRLLADAPQEVGIWLRELQEKAVELKNTLP